MLLALGATPTHAQRIRIPTWSAERPDRATVAPAALTEAVESARPVRDDSAASTAARDDAASPVRTRVGSDLDLDFDLPSEPRIASLDGPATLDTRGLAIADGFVNLDGWNQNCPTCPPARPRRFSVFGEFLYLRVRDAEVAFAVPIDGPITPPATPRVEVGPVAVADPDYQPGFRVGLGFSANDCTLFTAAYSHFEADTTEHLAVGAPFVLDSLVQHPSVQNVGSDFQLATGQYGISFDLLDVTTHRLLSHSQTHQLGVAVGLRYAQIEQNFAADFSVTGTENVTTGIEFEGLGLRGGVEYEQYVSCRMLVYAKGYGSLVPGEAKASYLQSQSFDNRVVNTSWKAGRVMTMWDLEMGAGISSKCRNYRLTAGYVYSAWTNLVQTDQWIRGVHANDFIGMDDTTTLDGWVARLEARF